LLPPEYRPLLEEGSPLADLYLSPHSEVLWAEFPEKNIDRYWVLNNIIQLALDNSFTG